MNDECGHKDDEDCLICRQCGECREDVNDEDICMDCQREIIDRMIKYNYA